MSTWSKILLVSAAAMGGLLLGAAPAGAVLADQIEGRGDVVILADGDSSAGQFVAGAGLVGVVAGPALYIRVKRKYSLTDKDDTKDQGIGSWVTVHQRSDTRGRGAERATAGRYAAMGMPHVVTYKPPPGGGDTRAQEISVQ
ncbi:MAG: hypothetical protein LBO75_02900 [Bifidobacteriaceae bacterium]|nr:hypothetical protein [Bifidobacteriaceae bacterium]